MVSHFWVCFSSQGRDRVGSMTVSRNTFIGACSVLDVGDTEIKQHFKLPPLTSQTANNFTEQTEATHPQLELTEPAATTCSAFLHPHSATYHLPFYSYLDPWSQHLQALSNCEETNFFFPLKPMGSFQLWFCSISCGDTADRAFLLAVLPFHRSHDT